MAFGIPYCGSKNIYAKKICEALPAGERLVDLFAGGCAITDCAMKMFKNKWKKYLINDINSEPINLYISCLAGINPVSYDWVSPEEFKKADWATRLVWSYANGLRSYIYGKNVYEKKKDLWESVSSNVLKYGYQWFLDNVRSDVTRHQPLESLHRLESLECLECLEFLRISYISYLEYNHKEGDVVYCDIPYYKTRCEQYANPFNHEEFWNWARTRPYDVYVSERTIPDDATIIFERDIPNRRASRTQGYRTEYLVKI